MTTFDAHDGLICMGSYDGRIYIYSMNKEQYENKAFEIAIPANEGQIVNCIKYLPNGKNNKADLLTSCND